MAYKYQLPSMKPKAPRKPAAVGKPTAVKPAPPAVAPAVASAALPIDPAYDQQIAALQTRRDDALAGLAGRQSQTLQSYGYGATFDPSGGVASLTLDPNNPYSRAALARKAYLQSKTATTNGLAARGQLYAGAMQQRQDLNDTDYQRTDDSLQKQLIDALGGVAAGRSTAQTDYETGAGTATGDRISRAQSNPTYSPTSPAPAASAAAAAGDTAAKKAARNAAIAKALKDRQRKGA